MTKALRRVAFNGDIALLRQLLVTATNEQKAAALRRAVDGGQFYAVSELVRADAPILPPAFIVAVRKGHGRIVESLLGFGADVNSTAENGESALMIAIRGRDETLASVLLDHGADVNIADMKMRIALLNAVTGHQWKIVEKLIEKGAKASCWSYRLLKITIRAKNITALRGILKIGADPNEMEVNEPPHIVMAAKAGRTDMVSALIEADADVNLRMKQCRTALMWAAEQGNEGMVTTLIKAGANVNASIKLGHTAIMWAVEAKHEKVVSLLIDNGANVEMSNACDRTAISPLARRKDKTAKNLRCMLSTAIIANSYRRIDESYFPIINLAHISLQLWRQLDKMFSNSDFSQADTLRMMLNDKLRTVDCGDKYNRTVLMFACAFGFYNVTKMLLSFGASVHIRDNQGMDSLMWAANGGNPSIVPLLMLSGAFVNGSDNRSRTCLHHALRGLDLPMVKVIMKAGGRLKSPSLLGEALIWAAKQGHAFVVNELLGVSVNPNVTDQDGGTPLIWASANGHIDNVWWLLRAHARIDIADRYRKRALFYALDGGHVQVFTALVTSNANTNDIERGYSALCVATRLQQLEFVRILLRFRGVNKRDVGRDGMTPLMYACRNKCADIVQLLLEHESPTNMVNSCGDTALHLASRADAANCVRLLLMKNTDVEARAKEGRTALIEAARLGNVAAVFALLAGRANVDAVDDQAKSALDFAVPDMNTLTEERARVAQVLISWGASSPTWKEIDRAARTFLGGDNHKKEPNKKRKRVTFGGVDFIRRNRRNIFV